MTAYLTSEQQDSLVAALRTRQDMRNLLRKMRDSEDRHTARIADRALVRALRGFSLEAIAHHCGASPTTVSRYRLKVLFSEAMPTPRPSEVQWDQVDEEIRTNWHLARLCRQMGPSAIARKFKVSHYYAEFGGEFLPNSRPAGGVRVMATAAPELREAVIEARNAYKATKEKRLRFTYAAIAERHGLAMSTVSARARELYALEGT